MMMQMLQAGGLEILTDAVRMPDASNPKGYLEFEAVKDLDKGPTPAWLGQARGKAVKIVSSLVTWLPETYNYQVIFMRRNLDEVIASQNKMLVRPRHAAGFHPGPAGQGALCDARGRHAPIPEGSSLGVHAGRGLCGGAFESWRHRTTRRQLPRHIAGRRSHGRRS